MRIMITGGGTGGHTSPAVAIIEELRKRDPRLILQWVGRKGSVEERVCATIDVPFRSIPVEGWPRKKRLRKIWTTAKLGLGILRSVLLLRKFHPQVVIGVGGYVSLPLMWAAQRMDIPTVLHEQNKRLGLANRILAPKAARVLLSFPETQGEYPKEKALVVGNPVRSGFLAPPDKATACEAFGLDPQRPVVLVCGGSQGARSINEALAGALPSFKDASVQFLWATGPDGARFGRDASETSQGVDVKAYAFIDRMVEACAAADLVVSRAGASTTAELALIGKPAILIPYPHATDDHQTENARAFERAGAAELIEDQCCTSEILGARIRALLDDPAGLTAMADAARGLAQPVAVETIVEQIFGLVFPQPEKV